MKRFAVIVLLLTYPGLQMGLSWLPSSGPRKAIDISVAADGSFTTSSWHIDSSHQMAIDYWEMDLTHRKSVKFNGYLAGWAHALSSDGTTVAGVTTEGHWKSIELISVADDLLKSRREMSDLSVQSLQVRMDFCGRGDERVLIDDHHCVFVLTEGEIQPQKIIAYDGYPKAAFGNQFFAISNRIAVPSNPLKMLQYDIEYRFYSAKTPNFKLVHRERRAEEDWEGRGVAVGADGTIAIQHTDHIQLRQLDGTLRRLEWPMEQGKLGAFDPTMDFLLLQIGQTLVVADANNGQQLAKRDANDQWDWWRCRFQDGSHLLLTEQRTGSDSDAESGRLVRWNWRNDTTTIRSIGGSDAETLARRLKWLTAVLLLWFVAASWVARTNEHWFAPTVVFVALTTFALAWAYNLPRFESNYIDGEILTLSWLTLTTSWLALSAFGCFAVCVSSGSLLRRVPIQIVIMAICAGRLHDLFAVGSWFFPLVILLTSVAIVAISCVIRLRGAVKKNLPRENESIIPTPGKRSLRLFDLLALVTALAVAFAFVSKFDYFDQTTESLGWALGCSLVLSLLAIQGVWTGIAKTSWWKRYPLLVATTFVMAWSFGRINWFDGGERHPFIHGEAFAIIATVYAWGLTYAAWLFRGQRDFRVCPLSD